VPLCSRESLREFTSKPRYLNFLAGLKQGDRIVVNGRFVERWGGKAGAIPCPLRNLKGALRKLRPRHSPENNLRKPLRFCRGSDPNAERLERFIWRGFYYRVSTGKQDIEMPAQRAAVEAFLNGGGWKIIGEEVEVETGTKTDAQRPKLAKALAIAKKHKATLVIAKLDRLARDTHFITGLRKSGVSFLCCDNPHANKMTIQLLAAFAEHERDQIAARTSAALQAKKASGKPWISKKSGRLVERLGSPNPAKGGGKERGGPKEGSQRVCLQDAADHRCDPGPRPHDVGADCQGTHPAEMALGPRRRGVVDDGGVEHSRAQASD